MAAQVLEVLTELDAVNLMLAAIGESPVNTVDDTGLVDAVIARNTLRNVSRQVQNRGWHFNTVDKMTLSPASPLPGEIAVPVNTLKCRAYDADYDKDVVLRGTKLFDRENNTNLFTAAIICQVVALLDFTDLPSPARDYIAMAAAKRFQQERVNSPQLAQFEASDMQAAWREMMRLETEARKTNMLRGSVSTFRAIMNRRF